MGFHSLVGQAAQDGRITAIEARELVKTAYRLVHFGADAAAAGDELAAVPWRGAELEDGVGDILQAGLKQLGNRPTEADQRARDLFVLGVTQATKNDDFMTAGEVHPLLDDAREDLASASDRAGLSRFYRAELIGLEDLGVRVDSGTIAEMDAFLRELDGEGPASPSP